LLLGLPVGRYWHHGRTLGGPSHPRMQVMAGGGAGLVAQQVPVPTARMDEAVSGSVGTRRTAGVVTDPTPTAPSSRSRG
jgi:hypothetical protein